MYILEFFLLIVLFIIVHNFAVRRLLTVELTPDEVHYTYAADGWRLAISRYCPPANTHGTPVILCHGLGANRYNMDFDDDLSLAKYLRDRGFDSWVAELRGVGLSSHPRVFSKWQYGYDFDDFALRDAPAIVEAVQAETGGKKVFWVGHSMGGMVGYVFLQGSLADSIKGMVAIASPPKFGKGGMLRVYIKAVHFGTSFKKAIHLEEVSRFFAPYAGWTPNKFLRIFANPDNMDRERLPEISANLSENISKGVGRQFADWIECGRMRSNDHRVDYWEGMKTIKTPILLISGGGDLLARDKYIKELFDILPEGDKTYQCFSKGEGHSHDYGHGDLVLGVNAHREVWPFISAWLEKRI